MTGPAPGERAPDHGGEVTPEEQERADAALAEFARARAAARENGEQAPRTSPGKFDGFAPGIDDDGTPFPPPRRREQR